MHCGQKLNPESSLFEKKARYVSVWTTVYGVHILALISYFLGLSTEHMYRIHHVQHAPIQFQRKKSRFLSNVKSHFPL